MLQDKYSEYSDSGLMWVREYPSHWNLTKVKYEAYVKARVGWHGLKTDDFTDVGPYLVTGSDFKSSIISWKDCYHCDLARYEQDCYIQLRNGDLLLTKDGTIGKIALVQGLGKDEKATLNSGVFVVRPLSNGFTTEFYFWLLESTVFKKFFDYFKTGSTIVHLYQDTFVNFSYASPPLSEQAQIAKFLDHETAQIDTLIEKQQTLIKLLKEKRQAVISHAVTKGLNPDAPMKDSGVEWLGDVPEHWEIQPIKYAFKSLNFRRIPLSGEVRGERKGIFRYYGASGVIDYIDDYIFDESTVLVGEDGANLVSRSTPLAFSAHGKYWVNNHAHILEPKDHLADYWAEAIEHIDINPIVTGSAQPKLTAEALSNLKITFPTDLDERIKIDNYIKSRKENYDNLISKAQQAIQLMQERRTALISATVTGKIDVRGWKAHVSNNT